MVSDHQAGALRLQPGSETNSDHAYAMLRRAIVVGRYRPGDRLTEIALTVELGMSRTPVREAIRRLQAEGLIVIGHRGALVRRLSVLEVSSLYQVRAALEALTAELAARAQREGRVSARDMRELVDRQLLFEQAVRERSVTRMVQANLAIHQYIARLAGNPFAQDVLRRVWDIIALSSIHNLQDDTWARKVITQHRRLIRAVRAGDTRQAAAVARSHVLEAATIYMARLPTTGEGEEPVDTGAPVFNALLGSGRLILKRPRG